MSTERREFNDQIFQWAVVGAGPAGIAAVGKLIDKGINPQEILWLDPAFQVGDLGALWNRVSSNTTVKVFKRFLTNCDAFNFDEQDKQWQINHLLVDETCELSFVVKPLETITHDLMSQVTAKKEMVYRLNLIQQRWEIQTQANHIYCAKQVILAIGCEPEVLDYPGPKVVTLSHVLDKTHIPMNFSQDDEVAVFGSSHSAIMAIRHLLEFPVRKIINFYQSPLRYAVDLDDWILFDNTGLKGTTATWARQNIDGNCANNLIRVLSTEENIHQHLPQCEKVVYAIGFKRRLLPIVQGMRHLHYHYNQHNGIIAPGLFGLGIAFPQAKMDHLGMLEHRVGMWKFMDYLNSVLPIWQKYLT